MPDRIREETDDVIILDTSKFSLFTSGIFTLILISWTLFLINRNSYKDTFFVFILIAGSILFISKILIDLQVIIVNKQSQSVTIQFLYITIKEIPFSDIEKVIYSDPTLDCSESIGAWRVSLITIQGDSFEIYHAGGNELDAEVVAEKIRVITGKIISYPY